VKDFRGMGNKRIPHGRFPALSSANHSGKHGDALMINSSRQQKAQTLLALHHGPSLLLLPNIWNPIGARVLAAKGYPAVATASAAISASLGYQDGEKIRRSTLIDLLTRIASSVDIPVTADIEAGYASCLSELEETAHQILDAGVVGVNLEDSLGEGAALRSIDQQCQRIAAFRKATTERSVHMVINARVDCFLSCAFPDKTKAVEETALRAKAYVEAGADCIYPIGPGDETTVRVLRERIHAPINILASPSAAPLAVLQEIGINRVSFGPFIFRTCLATFAQIADTLQATGDYACLRTMMPGDQAGKFLRPDPE
jgi:2-methylisocitrate lyase-like PEP mutase family enzyme